MVASLVGFLGDLDLAEEATADAFMTAAERAPGRHAAEPGRLADHHRKAARDRPDPPPTNAD